MKRLWIKKRKKLWNACIAMVMVTLLWSTTWSVWATYEFSNNMDYDTLLGNPTTTDEMVSMDSLSENNRRNKDSALFPPPYGVFSGNIPTDKTSLYHDSSTSESQLGVTANGTDDSSNGMLPPTSTYSPDVANTEPFYYNDGSIGTLTIHKLNLTVKVYEGETLENMRIGVGHFAFTSAWTGNVAIAGHNRGVPLAIGGIKDLKNGDAITYTTLYGTRTYEVYQIKQISETDYSNLGYSNSNILTMITCVSNVPSKRWCVQAKEVMN